MTPAGNVMVFAVFDLCGVIRMTGPCGNGNFGIILALGVFVADKNSNGRSGGETVKNAA